MRALLSVADKTGIVELAQGLADRGWELVSTGGTARALTAAGLPVVAVSDLTGFPELLDGRVKTLHPHVHAGLLARRRRPDDLAALDRHGIGLIDLVAVNLYPFARAAASVAVSFDELLEEIDIGGPTLVRAAAKSFLDVLVAVDPGDYVRVLEECDRAGGPPATFRFALARKAFAHTAAYDETIVAALSGVDSSDGAWRRRPLAADDRVPDLLRLVYPKFRDLRYGENPHQRAAWYAASGEAGFGAAEVIQGKEPSFTNVLDLDAAARLVLEFDAPAAAVVKHTNPCGVAEAAAVSEAYVRARDADPISAFGGIVGLNRPIDVAVARALAETFIEAVVAPAVDETARLVLAGKPAMRVVVTDFSSWRGSDPTACPPDVEVRSVLGGLLVEERDRAVEATMPWPSEGLRVVTRRAPTETEWRALRFAWRVCAHVKSNAIVFAYENQTAAVGAGQMSRVDAVRIAVMKAAGDLRGTVAASDAFFPFPDGVEAIAVAGATAVVQPGGSVRDAEVIAAADTHGLTMVFTGHRHFRH